jgi:hypothetical protein
MDEQDKQALALRYERRADNFLSRKPTSKDARQTAKGDAVYAVGFWLRVWLHEQDRRFFRSPLPNETDWEIRARVAAESIELGQAFFAAAMRHEGLFHDGRFINASFLKQLRREVWSLRRIEKLGRTRSQPLYISDSPSAEEVALQRIQDGLFERELERLLAGGEREALDRIYDKAPIANNADKVARHRARMKLRTIIPFLQRHYERHYA